MSDTESRLQRLEDIEAIRALDAQYCWVLDDGDWAALVDLFTADGVFVGLSEVQGHAALYDFFSGLADGGLTAFWHYVTNLEIEVTGDTAHARSCLWQPCVLHDEPHIAAGRYTDDLLRVDGRWRYRRKQIAFDYFARAADGWARGRFALESARATQSAGQRRV